MSHQSRFDAPYWMLGAGALGRPRGMVWGGRREEGSGWGTHVCLWRIHFNIWQNQYNIVKFKNKIKLQKNNNHSYAFYVRNFPLNKWKSERIGTSLFFSLSSCSNMLCGDQCLILQYLDEIQDRSQDLSFQTMTTL